jgi:hypothetical protein
MIWEIGFLLIHSSRGTMHERMTMTPHAQAPLTMLETPGYQASSLDAGHSWRSYRDVTSLVVSAIAYIAATFTQRGDCESSTRLGQLEELIMAVSKDFAGIKPPSSDFACARQSNFFAGRILRPDLDAGDHY